MQIFVKNFGGKTFTINVNINHTISEVKEELLKKAQIPLNTFGALVFAGK
jgi:hypothetical protein